MNKKYFNKKDLDSRLDFFQKINPPQIRKKLNWALFISLFVVVTSILLITQKTIQLSDKNTVLNAKKQKLESLTAQITKKTKQITADKSLNFQLKKNLLKSESYKIEQIQISQTIQDISNSLPKDSWLESISVLKKTKLTNNTKIRKIVLIGYSGNGKAAETYVNSIKQCKQINECNLEKIQILKDKSKELGKIDSFKFKIICELNPITSNKKLI
jgi:hypothetical protein